MKNIFTVPTRYIHEGYTKNSYVSMSIGSPNSSGAGVFNLGDCHKILLVLVWEISVIVAMNWVRADEGEGAYQVQH